MTFADHARQIAMQLLADCEHADFSAVNVMRLLSQKRRQPVSMPVVFTSLLGYGGVLKRPVRIDAIGSYVRGATRTPQVLLDAQALEAPDGLHISWDVMEDVLAPDLLNDMFHGFTLAVEQLAKNETFWNAPVMRLASPQVLQHANSTATRLPLEPIFAGILRQAALEPGRLAVVAADRRLTFGELAGEARCLAKKLTEHGVQLGDLVAVVAPKGWRQIVAVLAISMSGAAYVPVELPMPADRIAQVLTRAGTKLALVHGAPADTVWPCPVVDTWDLDTKTPFDSVPVGPTDLAYVIYTSGSTGTPKGVALDHGAVSNTLHSVNNAFAIDRNDCVLGVSSLAFDLSVWDIFGVLGAGGRLVLPDPQSLRDPEHLADLCHREGVTVWNSTPSYLKLVVEAPRVSLPLSLRLFMLSGDWIPLELARFLRKHHSPARLVSLGGATEAAIWSIWHEVDEIEEHWRSVPYGKAMPNQRFHVLDEALNPTNLGEVGQLHIAGSGLARCYWRDEAQTGASFIRHPVTGERLYRTGDYGRVMEDGSIEFLGRRDAQVKVGGHRIELGEVEAALANLSDDLKVSDGVAFTFADASGNQRLGLCYRSASRTSEAEVRRALAARLPGYLTPSAIILLSEIPLTDNGKVNRKALGALALQQSGAPSVSEKLGALLSDDRMLKDSQERSAFVAAHHGNRRDLDIAPAKELAIHEGVAATVRRSTRSFAASTPADDVIAALLAPLREIATADGAHREYASAGSSYAVQAYVIRKSEDPARHVLSYFDPVQHRLLKTGEVIHDIANLHAPANRAMATSAPLTILLVGDRRAIEPLYGNLSDDMMRIEAGAMAQLLSNSATTLGLGHCAVGWLDISPLRDALRLSQEHVFIHAMVAGDPAGSEKPSVVLAAQRRKAETSTAKDKVRAAWSSVLGHDNFADDASFFEVGGDSFMAVALQAKLAESFTPAPSVTDLFRHPTVVDLANYLQGGGTPPEPKPAPSVAISSPSRRNRRLDARRSLNGSSAGGRA
jgi:amino acid adenylation domain-containing protein